MNKILVYLENQNNKIEDVSFELLTKANEMSVNFENVEIIGVYISQEDSNNYEIYKNYGLNRVIEVKTVNLSHYSTIEYANIMCQIIENEKPEIVLIGATYQGRDLAPRISNRIKTGLTADCTNLEIKDDFKLYATRPTFGGSLMATILCRTFPQMATVRPKVFKHKYGQFVKDTIVQKSEDFQYSNIEFIQEKETENQTYDFSDAEIILAGGLGLKNKENFENLKKLAKKLNAKVGATRAAVEKGLIEQYHQIGQTGQSVSPKLYIAFGISGAIQHVSGMEKSLKVVAVNKDINAPIFKIADYSIVADAQELIKNWLDMSEK